jgi:hypothetical protein
MNDEQIANERRGERRNNARIMDPSNQKFYVCTHRGMREECTGGYLLEFSTILVVTGTPET